MSQRIVVNPIACVAHGMCAEILPERVVLDDWGYPIVDERPLSVDLLEHARRAAQACPTFALLLRAEADPAQGRQALMARSDGQRRARPSARRA